MVKKKKTAKKVEKKQEFRVTTRTIRLAKAKEIRENAEALRATQLAKHT